MKKGNEATRHKSKGNKDPGILLSAVFAYSLKLTAYSLKLYSLSAFTFRAFGCIRLQLKT
jgi:hypothetical protein